MQELAIPKVLSGRHVLIVAPTGSGKTEAAVFPILSEMVKRGSATRISMLYITPLRALNRDVMRRVQTIASKLNIEVAVRHGDTPSSVRRALSLRPPHVLVTTPETFSYILVNRRLREHLRNVRWVVIDELHELLESKRGSQVSVNLERLAEIAGDFQRIGLSASVGDIKIAKEFLAYGRYVEEVVVEGVRDMEVSLISGYYSIDQSEKVKTLVELLKKHRGAIVFTNTRDEAELVGRKLAEAGLSVRVHHGSLSREEREEAERLLREGALSCVVATSSLELGIDVGSVDAVIQISSPRQVSKLVQRVGRARHSPFEKALGYIICDDSLDDIVESAVIIRRAKSGLIEKPRPYEKPYDVLVHTLVGMGLEGGYTLERAYRVISRSYPYSKLTPEEFKLVVDKAVEMGYLRLLEGGKLMATERGKIYYMTTTTIVDTASYDVVDSLTRRTIGSLDEDFVAELVESSTLILSGRLWRVVAIDSESKKVFVEEMGRGEALIPSWTGETIPVDRKVAREACGVLRVVFETGKLPSDYAKFMNKEAVDYVEKVMLEQKLSGRPVPSDNTIVVEYLDGDRPLLVILSCLGTRGNKSLAYLLLGKLNARYCISPAYKTDPYRVIVELPYRLPPEEVLELVRNSLMSDKVLEELAEGLKNSRLFDILLFNVGKRLGTIPDVADPRIIKAAIIGLRNDRVAVEEAIREGFTRYLDPSTILELVGRIREGRARVVSFVDVKLPPLAVEGLKDVKASERIRGGALPRNMIAEIVRRRILEKDVLLVCLHCGHSWTSKVKDLEDRIRCGRCGYGLVGVSKSLDEEVVKVARRAIKLGKDYRFKLSDEEVKIFERLMESAILVLDFGRRAVEALAAHGIGPESARRALQHVGEDFYVKLYELEKQYIRTRRFWD